MLLMHSVLGKKRGPGALTLSKGSSIYLSDQKARIDLGKSAIDKEVVEKAGRSVALISITKSVCADRIAPGLASQFDWPCTVPAIAPRPLLILNGIGQRRPPDSY
ncbi:hypothetical protein OROMI_017249 [Orobanche minor]